MTRDDGRHLGAVIRTGKFEENYVKNVAKSLKRIMNMKYTAGKKITTDCLTIVYT